MTVRLVALAIDALDPPALARFWAFALGGQVEGGGSDDEVRVQPSGSTPFGFVFRRVDRPKTERHRVHPDLTTSSPDDQAAAVAALLERGARHLDIGQGPDATHVVLADPEGNELCIIEPQNRFLAGCPRLGALAGDGSRATGVFWSEALGWPLVWDQDDETAIRWPAVTGTYLTWGGEPDLPEEPSPRCRFELAADGGATVAEAVGRLVGLGAREVGADPLGGSRLRDPDGNLFVVR